MHPYGSWFACGASLLGVVCYEQLAGQLASCVNAGILDVTDDGVRFTQHGTMFANDAMLLFIA